jgi:predicted DNA-binding mobile mystery protein A
MYSEKRQLLEFVVARQKELAPIQHLEVPNGGWIQLIRKSIGMSLRQLGARLNISAQSVRDIERREAQGSITLSSLQEAAKALDMKVVYAIVPETDTLQTLIEKRARVLATEIVERAHHNMLLDHTEMADEKKTGAIQERTHRLINEMPRYLWD